MARIRTNPFEWERMLQLLDIKKRTAEEQEELEKIQELFRQGSNKRQDDEVYARRRKAVLVLDEDSQVIHRSSSIAEFMAVTGYPNSVVYKSLNEDYILEYGKYEGCSLMREEYYNELIERLQAKRKDN